MGAADDVGDDLEVGLTNHSQAGTELVGTPGDEDDFVNDYVFQAFVSPVVGHAVDALRGIARGPGSGVFGTSTAPGVGVLGQLSGGGAGVRGVNDEGPGVHGFFAATASSTSGVGVLGEAQDPENTGFRGIGVQGTSKNGTGVDGISNGTETDSIGVHGQADNQYGVGVRGESGDGIALQGLSGNGYGLDAQSAGSIAVNGLSGRDRAAVLQSGDEFTMGGSVISAKGRAQLRLVPAQEAVLPTSGELGDIWAHFSQPLADNRRKSVTLWLCVSDDPVEWEKITVSGVRVPGGASAD
jgi:hypothetical protein